MQQSNLEYTIHYFITGKIHLKFKTIVIISTIKISIYKFLVKTEIFVSLDKLKGPQKLAMFVI